MNVAVSVRVEQLVSKKPSKRFCQKKKAHYANMANTRLSNMPSLVFAFISFFAWELLRCS